MDEVRTSIEGLPLLERRSERTQVQSRLEETGLCLLVGESGSGKSSLAKTVALDGYDRVFWPSPNDLDVEHREEWERRLGLRHPLGEVLHAANKPCIVVFDAAERYSQRAIRQAAALIQELRRTEAPRRGDVIVTLPFEQVRRILDRLVEHGVDRSLLTPVPIQCPQENEIRDLVLRFPALRWAAVRPEMCAVLGNLKVLDWAVQFARTGGVFAETGVVGLTALIDALWQRWAEGDDGFAGADLLKKVAVLEAEGLSAGVPRTRLQHAESQSLSPLLRAGLVRLREERVHFTHDLLGDWARLRVLVGEAPTASVADRARAALPRWHRAVRLYGQRLLESGREGQEEWHRAVTALGQSDEAGVILRDLLLEAVFLATNARGFIGLVWPTLATNEGHLLNRLLDRFLYVATFPNPRIAEVAENTEDAARLELLCRIPFGPYWGPLLTALQAHRDDVACLAPILGARVCVLWLRTTPPREGDKPFPWRREAAELAVAIARECHARTAEGDGFSDDNDSVIYEALLLAAPDLPDEVGTLCLELAQRRPPAPEIQERAERAQRKREEADRQWREANPEKARLGDLLCRPMMPLGPLRLPWPDGPHKRVSESFRKACLDTEAFSSLILVRPDTAQEVLLAVCIEEPRHENFYGYSIRRKCGVESWFSGNPPLFLRGPFLVFLRQAPDQGLTFVLRLVNFASQQWAAEEPHRRAWLGEGRRVWPDEANSTVEIGVTVTIDGVACRWLGNDNVFRWHHDWPHAAHVIPCALMAVERWLYEQLDQNIDVTPWLSRLLRESESLAFAGLLLDVGKYRTSLFKTVLRPLLGIWELYSLDLHAVVERRGTTVGLIGWAMRQGSMMQQAREWYGMPHRKRLFRDLAVHLLHNCRDLAPFFEDVRAAWAALLDADRESESLRLVIETLNPANYVHYPLGDGRIYVVMRWPEDIQRRNEEEQKHSDAQMLLMMFPWQCRKRLEEAKTLTDDELPAFWDSLRRLSEGTPIADKAGYVMVDVADAVCGGIAVLLILHRAWVASDPSREGWCRQELAEAMTSQRTPRPFDCAEAVGETHWDAFAAECGVLLLAENADDILARQLVATGIVALRYTTVARTMARAFRLREALGEDFARLLHFAVCWSGIRCNLQRAGYRQMDQEPWLEAANHLYGTFIDRDLPPEVPSFREANREATAAWQQFFQDCRGSDALPLHRSREQTAPRDKVPCEHPHLDVGLLRAAFGWLDVGAARTGGERTAWLRLAHGLLDLCLGQLPTLDDSQGQEIDDLPTDFDQWVFGVMAQTIPLLRPDENPQSLWMPILDRGTPAHHWVEHFFWAWFPHGAPASVGPDAFTALWAQMIRYAATHSSWDPDRCRTFRLDDMVSELLGFHWGVNTILSDERYAAAVGRMQEVFALAARRWFGSPGVAGGFARFVRQPGARELLLPSVRWFHDAVHSYDDQTWRGSRGLADDLAGTLRVCWDRHSRSIAGDPDLRSAFLNLLTRLAPRAGHTALALRDQILSPITGPK